MIVLDKTLSIGMVAAGAILLLEAIYRSAFHTLGKALSSASIFGKDSPAIQAVPATMHFFASSGLEKPIEKPGVALRNPSDSTAPSAETDPWVSVIIPCYNCEGFLEEAIQSALAQSYPRVEIIVVDDGSTDRSGEIAQRLPVRYIYQENRGLAESRNLGIRESKGSYTVFLDADDRLRPEAIETGVRVLEQRRQCAMAVGDHVFVSAGGAYLAGSRKHCLVTSHYEALLRSNFIEMISSVLFRRSVLEEFGGFDTRLRVAEDYELYMRIARAHPICCHSAIIAEYRIHDSNTSRNSELMLTMTLQVLKSQARYIRSDPRRMVAFQEGHRCWRRQYGRQLASELAHSFFTLRKDELFRKLSLLASHYPQGLLMIVLLRIMPALGRRHAVTFTSAVLRGQGKDRDTAASDILVAHQEPRSEQVSASFGDSEETVAPLVSVVIPCCNSARYLSESIESVLRQTHLNIEIIVIDDGSTDETPGIAHSYPVAYFRQENRGVSAARNRGIFHSRGKYVLFLDSDDRLLPEAVATGVRLLEGHPECSVAVGEHRYIGADGTLLGYSNKHSVGRDHYRMLLKHNFIETPCSALHRRSSLLVTGVFDETLRVGEDHELYLRTARRTAMIGHDAAVSEYRLHDANVSRNAELMLSESYRVVEMELPHVQGDREKLRLHRSGLRFVERRFGRQLSRELIRDGQLTSPEGRRKLKLLKRHYPLGFAAVVLSRLLPVGLLKTMFPPIEKRRLVRDH